VVLKYGPVIKLQSVEYNPDGSINHVKVEILPDYSEKLKGYIQWVSKEHSVNVTCNLYSIHFLIEDIKKAGDKWLEYINPESLVVKNNAKIWDMHKKNKVNDRFQFERCGYFVIDEGSEPSKGLFNFNRIVELKESKDKAVNIADAKK
jgi:glutaminyl-tRNA synthetase